MFTGGTGLGAFDPKKFRAGVGQVLVLVSIPAQNGVPLFEPRLSS